MQGMTKNPLALGAGVLLMLFGIALACFFGYQFFLEERMYRNSAASTMGEIVRKEQDERYADALDETATATKPSTSAAAPATDSTSPTTTTTSRPYAIIYKLHYAFTPAGATTAVTGEEKVNERLFKRVEEKQQVEVLYKKEAPADDHRVLFPVEFGSSFYAGVSVLLGGCLFIAYLGWCFIFPEDEPASQPASERKKSKKKKKGN